MFLWVIFNIMQSLSWLRASNLVAESRKVQIQTMGKIKMICICIYPTVNPKQQSIPWALQSFNTFFIA
ncbi:hypothetical protein CIPAW_05G152900 [Carya illinoinensis]|uniref:Secreted protein n=1 Tax=Carya illinoinensis TaxID=32201 RepID=A0A8T1QK61_CARIL|nr:hypothetical protein CIPAW_05G152900 [Carya illinoinensis]